MRDSSHTGQRTGQKRKCLLSKILQVDINDFFSGPHFSDSEILLRMGLCKTFLVTSKLCDVIIIMASEET